MLNEDQIKELRTAWKVLCFNNYQNMGDVGSCVIGAGLRVGPKMIIRSSEVCQYQGSIVWESGLDKLVSEFNSKYNCHVTYDAGSLD